MKKSHYTLVIIPKGGRAVRKIRLPIHFATLIVLLAVLLAASLSYLSWDVITRQETHKKLMSLSCMNESQRDQIDLLRSKIEFFEKSFEEKMAELNDFERKIRVMANLEPEEDGGVPLMGVGGSIPDDSSPKSRVMEMEQALISEIHKNVDQLLDEASIQQKSFAELLQYLEKQKSILASTPSIWPVMGWVTSEFGYRVSPFNDRREFHKGIDIAARLGKEILAPADGVVAKVSTNDRWMGNVLWIDHTKDLSTCYGHLLKITVEVGRKVKRGDVIGYVGNTGRSTGAHLHYSVMDKGVYVNPRRYLF